MIFGNISAGFLTNHVVGGEGAWAASLSTETFNIYLNEKYLLKSEIYI